LLLAVGCSREEEEELEEEDCLLLKLSAFEGKVERCAQIERSVKRGR
jgi:hypothetical protein